MLNQKQINNALTIYCGFLLLSFIFPIHASPFRTYFQEVLAPSGLIAAFAYLACSPRITIRFPSLLVIPVALIAMIAIQFSHGLILTPVDMVFPILNLVGLGCAMTFGATLAMSEDGIERLSLILARTFILAGLICVVLQHLQILNLPLRPLVFPLSFQQQVRPYANLGQPNLLALILCFSVAAVWFAYLKHRIRPLSATIIVLALLWGIALTQSRIAWLILPVYVLACWQEPIPVTRAVRSLSLKLLLLFFCFVFIVPHFLELFGITVDAVQQRAGQNSVRLHLWQEALHMSATHPWLGVGWYQFGPQQILLATFFSPTEYSDNAHNIVMNLSAEVGWPLTVLLVFGIMFWFYVACIRRWGNVEVRFLSLLLLAIGMHSLVEFPLWFGFILIPFGVVLGALQIEKLGWSNCVIPRAGLAGLTILSMVLVTGITLDYLRVVNGFVALKAEVEGKKAAIGSTQKPEFTLFPQYYDFFRVFKINVGPGVSEASLHLIERTSLRFGHPLIFDRLALLYANNQRPSESLQVLITMQRLFPAYYADTYTAWKNHAQVAPSLYAPIFERMPIPEQPKRVQEAVKSGA